MPSGAVLSHLAFWEAAENLCPRQLASTIRAASGCDSELASALAACGRPIEIIRDEMSMIMTTVYHRDKPGRRVYVEPNVNVLLTEGGTIGQIEFFME
jgi:hypothetical protein